MANPERRVENSTPGIIVYLPLSDGVNDYHEWKKVEVDIHGCYERADGTIIVCGWSSFEKNGGQDVFYQTLPKSLVEIR